jgi:hypothetical protein
MGASGVGTTAASSLPNNAKRSYIHQQEIQQQQQQQQRYSPYSGPQPKRMATSNGPENSPSVLPSSMETSSSAAAATAAKNFLTSWNCELMSQQSNSYLAAVAAAAAAASANPVAGVVDFSSSPFFPQLSSFFNFKSQFATNSAFKHHHAAVASMLNQQQQQPQDVSVLANNNNSINLSSSINTSGYSTFADESMQNSSSSLQGVGSSSSSSSSYSSGTGFGLADSDMPAVSSRVNSAASLAHIMNWIRNTPSVENLLDVSSKHFYATLRWAKSQKNFISLPLSDQNALINENIAELFVLQMAESRAFSNGCGEMNTNSLFVAENEQQQQHNEERRQFIVTLQSVLQKFHLDRVDPMEFYLLKSISLFRSGIKIFII